MYCVLKYVEAEAVSENNNASQVGLATRDIIADDNYTQSIKQV